jgi:hypothetical protein
MDIHIFSSQELESVFRVLRSALNPSETLLPQEQKFLETYAKITNFSLPQKIQPLSANEVSIEDPHKRKRVIQLSAMAVLLSNPIRKESITYLKELSQKLSTTDPVIKVIEALSQKKIWKARLLTIRRGMRSMLKEAYLAEGWMGIYRFFIALFFRARVNKDKNWNFKKIRPASGWNSWSRILEAHYRIGFWFSGRTQWHSRYRCLPRYWPCAG